MKLRLDARGDMRGGAEADRTDRPTRRGGGGGPHGLLGWEHVNLRLVPLGTNWYIPSHGRQTMCFLLLDGDGAALLLDAGTGLARLLAPEIAALLAPAPPRPTP